MDAPPIPYVFVVGAARSGTELLRRILDAHPEIAMTPESHWITRYQKAGLVPNGVVSPALIDRLKHGHWFGLLGITDRELDDLVARRGDWSYATFVSAIFDLYGQRRNKPLVGDKTPSHVRSISTLHRLFPDAKIVHIIRDGRDVTLSLLDWPKAGRVVGRFSTWSDDPVSTSALWWEWSVRRGREAAAELPPGRYLEIKYEAVVREPEETVAALCEFLHIEYAAEMLAFHRGREVDDPALDAKDAWRPITPGLRDWRRQMTSDQLELFEDIAGDLLRELDYPSARQRTGAHDRSHADALRKRFIDDANQQGSPVPKQWHAER